MVNRKRHIAKALTWRLVGTLDTMIISWIITGNALIGISIGIVEVISKTVLYYFHERLWYKFSKFGVDKKRTK